MNRSRKYGANGKTFHVPWSPGTDSTDRKNWEYWNDIQKIKELVFTSKLDGEGSCLNEYGVFARSHAAPSDKPWSAYLRQKHAVMVHDLKRDGIELFLENMYPLHSIEYPRLDEHCYVFAVRHLDQWLSWEEVEWWSAVFDFKTVPVLGSLPVSGLSEVDLIKHVNTLGSMPEVYGSYDVIDGGPCSREGIVFRNKEGFHVDEFVQNLFKMVRASHVKTDEHWERNWRRSFLRSELESFAESNSLQLTDDEQRMRVIAQLRRPKA